MKMQKFFSLLVLLAIGATVTGADFFALPEDKGKELPADKVYPNGRIFPIMTYTGGILNFLA